MEESKFRFLKASNVLLFCFLSLFWACSGEEDPEGKEVLDYDPNLPVVINTFMPDSGGIREKFIVTGSNFGGDVSKIQVLFRGNKKAVVLNSNGNTIYCMVPKQAPGDNTVTVVVGSDTCQFTNKLFRYKQRQAVSLVAGKETEKTTTDGTITTARFKELHGCVLDADDNILVTESWAGNLRLVSEADNKVATILTNFITVMPAITKARDKIYCIGRDNNAHAVFCLEKANLWAARKIIAGMSEYTGQIYSGALDDNEDWLYFRSGDGKFGRMNIADPTKRELLLTGVGAGAGVSEWTCLIWCSVRKSFFLAIPNTKHGIYRIWKEESTETWKYEEWTGFNGSVVKDGYLDEATFNAPHGLVSDSEGNIYVSEYAANVIRRISIDGYVSTVAGKSGTKGVANGDPLSEATFDGPLGMAIDSEDRVIIVEQGNACIRRLAIE